MTTDEIVPTLTTANLWHDGIKYPVGTPIEALPEKLLLGLTPASVDGPLPFEPPEEPRRRPRPKRPTNG